jgi:hypothetical protein
MTVGQIDVIFVKSNPPHPLKSKKKQIARKSKKNFRKQRPTVQQSNTEIFFKT